MTPSPKTTEDCKHDNKEVLYTVIIIALLILTTFQAADIMKRDKQIEKMCELANIQIDTFNNQNFIIANLSDNKMNSSFVMPLIPQRECLNYWRVWL